MKHTLFFLFLLFSSTIKAQYTSIPDIDFEKALINQGIDSGILDGKVLTSKINPVTNLNLSNLNISDLTGIEGFVNLTHFYCHYNKLTSLDVSKNTKLIALFCYNNSLTYLNVSKNIDLKFLDCKVNFLTQLDVSNNINLTNFYCDTNSLTYLNLKNGYNNRLLINYSSFWRNANLLCIIVDDDTYSNANWYFAKDATASFTTFENPAPDIPSPQFFCIANTKTLADLTITTSTNISWYNTLTGGNTIPNTTLLADNTTYYASQKSSGCESARTPVLINIQNTLAPTAYANQQFCTSQNPTIANIQITGNLIKWYDNSINGNLLTTTTNLQNGKTYYASQTINNCESERLGVAVSIVNTPLAPTANSNQSYCKKENATLKDIQITGQNIKWYDTTFTTAPLPETTLLENSKTYYASQTIGCESDRTPILIQVYDTPLPTGVNNQQFCIDENATISNLNIKGSNIKWYDQSSNGNIVPETTLLQNGITYFATQTLNNCESERLAIVAKIQDTPIPVANSEQIFCIQKIAKISDIAIAGQNINWFESESSSIILSESTSLQNATTYYASQTISNCESVRIPILIMILEATTTDCINFVDELPYPKFFTPNNDSYNDTWTIDFAYLKTNTGIKIFDRYGKLLKILNSNSDSWNGTYDGAELPATDYWFVVTRANGKEYKGHFSLKR